MFNAPALPRVHYAHFEDQQQAENILRELGQRIEEGKVIYVTCAHSSFAIPAHSVHYVALGASLAQRVNPDEGTPSAQAEHEARAFHPAGQADHLKSGTSDDQTTFGASSPPGHPGKAVQGGHPGDRDHQVDLDKISSDTVSSSERADQADVASE